MSRTARARQRLRAMPSTDRHAPERLRTRARSSYVATGHTITVYGSTRRFAIVDTRCAPSVPQHAEPSMNKKTTHLLTNGTQDARDMGKQKPCQNARYGYSLWRDYRSVSPVAQDPDPSSGLNERQSQVPEAPVPHCCRRLGSFPYIARSHV